MMTRGSGRGASGEAWRGLVRRVHGLLATGLVVGTMTIIASNAGGKRSTPTRLDFMIVNRRLRAIGVTAGFAQVWNRTLQA
jgi:hypothetical protein